MVHTRAKYVKELTREAVAECLNDAGAQVSHIEAAFHANCMQSFIEGQTAVGGQIALRAAGIEKIPIVNVENGCASGSTRLGGSIPTNVSGGLESKGYPVGATGLGQLFELVTQLHGRAGARQVKEARFAIQENGGGLLGYEEASAVVTILGKEK